MKQKILSTMIGTVMAGSMSIAAADGTFFGHIDTSANATDQDGGNDDINFDCNTCSIGYKGHEDLGNGLKAIYFLDFQYDVFSRDETSLLDRDQWLGLAGSNWGQIRWGTISTPYKSHGAMIDPLYRTALQGRSRGLQSDFHNGAGENLEGRAEQTARYDSPDWNGFKAAAFYTLDSDRSDGFGGTEDNDPYGVGAQYSNGNLLVFGDWQDNDGSKKDVGGEISAWKAGGKYSVKAFGMKFGFYGQYEDSTFDEASAAMTTDFDLQVWHVAGSVGIGNAFAYVGWGQGEFDFSAGDHDKYDALTIAAVYNFSKRTMVYAGYNQVDCDVMVSDSICEDVGGGIPGKGGEDEKVSFGMKHKF